MEMTRTPSKALRVVQFLQQALAPKGLDVVIPLTVEAFNEYLLQDKTAASDLRRFLLPIDEGGAIDASAPLKSHLMVLVGNSRAMWEPFLDFVAAEIRREKEILPHPIDRYAQECIQEVLRQCEHEQVATPSQVYWAASTKPGQMILAQRMAFTARAVSRCTGVQLCIHPVYGPWLGFRSAIVFPIEGVDEEEKPEPCPPLCSHSEEVHASVKAQMEESLSFVDFKDPCKIPPEAWKKTTLPRLTIEPNHPYMYAAEHFLYHYTKDVGFLKQVVEAREKHLCTDFFRLPPSDKAMECREVIQQVLRDVVEAHPNGIDAILLSGGLDTSLLAEASAQPWECPEGIGRFSLDKKGGGRPMLEFTHALTVQAHEAALDAQYASRIFEQLQGVTIQKHHILKLSLPELLQHTKDVAKLLCSFDPMELRNSLVIFAALKEASKYGVKHVVTGDGADELFCGYGFCHAMDEDTLKAYREHIIEIMHFTSSTLAQHFGIEVISPFVDKRVIAFARSLFKSDLVGPRTPLPLEGPETKHGKLVLRQAFPESSSQWRSKQPIESGSGSTELRNGFFDLQWSDAEFEAAQAQHLREHGVFVRDREHLHFFQAFLEVYDGDLSAVPKRRNHTKNGKSGSTKTCDDDLKEGVFCPACGFELSHHAQDFCVTCGFWPARATAVNDRQGLATKALQTLATRKAELMAL